jgi:hypothetical protein
MSFQNKMLKSIEKDGPGTVRELSERIGASFSNTGRLAKLLLKSGTICIVGKQAIKHRQGWSHASILDVTGKAPPLTRWQMGDHGGTLDCVRTESPEQAEAFAAAMKGQRYDSLVTRDVAKRLDLAAQHVPTQSALA